MKSDLKNKLMDYLYNEMTPEDRKQFESQLEGDAVLRQELEELTTIRRALAEMHDKEVVEPSTITEPTGTHGTAQSGFIQYLKPLVAVAASISLVLLTGYLTQFTIRYNDSGFYLGFVQQTTNSTINESEVLALIHTELAKNNQEVKNTFQDAIKDQTAQLDERFAGLTTDLQSKVQAVNKPSSSISEESMKAYIESTQASNIALLKQYLKLSNEQQQEYYQGLITQFSEYVQDQREEDLLLIQRSLLNLKQNQDIQKQETDQMLASLFTNVKNRND